MNIASGIKYLLSYTRRRWSVTDYPLRWTSQEPPTADAGDRSEWPAWSVQIIGWWAMIGTGATKQDALAKLQERLDAYAQTHAALPRPGTRVPLEFASTSNIEHYEPIARDFLQRVLHLNYDQCFISDQSSLIDFMGGEDYVETTRQIYGVDISDIEDGNLVAIFRRLDQQQRP